MSKLNLCANMVVGDAKLLRLLGAGASGEVWAALTAGGTIEALKIYEGKSDVKQKAEYECRMAGRFASNHILKPYGMVRHESHPVIRLPYCEGRSVDGVAAHLGEKMMWRLIENISSALAEIHGNGFGHFDVKPSNILWNGDAFLLSDFGACAPLHEAKAEDAATDGSSFRFDAPELFTQRCAASDVWSLGATVFFLYMGCHVFCGLGGRAQHSDSPVPYMRKSLPELSMLVQRCLDFDASKRPSAKEINEIARRELLRYDEKPHGRALRLSKKGSAQTDNDEFWSDLMVEP